MEKQKRPTRCRGALGQSDSDTEEIYTYSTTPGLGKQGRERESTIITSWRKKKTDSSWKLYDRRKRGKTSGVSTAVNLLMEKQWGRVWLNMSSLEHLFEITARETQEIEENKKQRHKNTASQQGSDSVASHRATCVRRHKTTVQTWD